MKPTLLILGKLPPPFIGPAIATQIILTSELTNTFNLIHIDTRINEKVASMGKWSFNKFVKSIQLYWHYIKAINQHQPNLILVPISQTTLGFLKDAPFIFLGKLKGNKVLIQLRGSNFKNWLSSTNAINRCFVKFTIKKTVGVIVLGKNLIHLFEDFFPKDRIFVVPNGANFTLEKRNSTKFTVLYFANFLPSKSFDEILKALVLLKEKGITDFQFNAVGAWDNIAFKKNCEAIISENKLTNVAIFPPQSGQHKMQFFANSDVFVFCPKMPEGHPWVIVEAMANGLPIISTNQGAIAESVIDNENGFIVPAENPEIIAEKLEFLIHNESICKKFGEKSAQFYSEKFTEKCMVNNLTKVFDYCIEPDKIESIY